MYYSDGCSAAVWSTFAPIKSIVDEERLARGPRWSRVAAPPRGPDAQDIGAALYEAAYGWPMLALKAEVAGNTSFTAWHTTLACRSDPTALDQKRPAHSRFNRSGWASC